MKNVVRLEHNYSPWERERAICQFVAYYNYESYHESLDNVTPADMYFDQCQEIMVKKAMMKQEILQ